MYKQILNDLKPHLEKVVDYLKTEFSSLQVGRATPALVEDIGVEYYGSRMLLKELAAIHVPDPRQILIQPWDKEILKNIEKAIQESKLRISPVVDGDAVRLNIPPLSEERRKELTKIVSEKIEESRISIRRQREDVWKTIQNLEKEGKISEDDKFKAKDELQKIIDDYNKKIEEIGSKKEQEIMKV